MFDSLVCHSKDSASVVRSYSAAWKHPASLLRTLYMTDTLWYKTARIVLNKRLIYEHLGV